MANAWNQFWDPLFGTGRAEDAAAAQAAAGQAIGAASQGAGAIGAQSAADAAAARGQGQTYDVGTQASMGANAADYMRRAQESAQAGASQAGQAAATQATQQGLRAARSAGLSKGQAALAGAQQAGNAFTSAYQGGLESGQNRYMAGTQQFAGQGSEMAGRANTAAQNQLSATGQQTQAALGQAQIAAQQEKAARQQEQNTWGTIGTTAGALATVLCDENAKKDIRDLSGIDVHDIANKIAGRRYKYKDGQGTPGEKVGVIAQDLIGTPLESMVTQTEDGKLMINSAELAPAVLGLLSQLTKEVEKMKGGKKNG